MNTSDQSLFPMDTAFKRRWDWEYVPIDYTNPISSTFVIKIGGKQYKWNDFLGKINVKIKNITYSEDKQMGNFFIKGDIDEAVFKDKVMFYLWSEVCKDAYKTQNNFFRTDDKDSPEFSFNELFTDKGRSLLIGFMKYNGIDPIPSPEEAKTEDSETE